jgi:hypothetical protein
MKAASTQSEAPAEHYAGSCPGNCSGMEEAPGAMSGNRFYVEVGGLMSYGPNNTALFRRAAGLSIKFCAGRATSIIPIVFAAAGNPVGSGLVASLPHPGGNLTGLSTQGADLAGRR